MTLFFDPKIPNFVKNLHISWARSLKWHDRWIKLLRTPNQANEGRDILQPIQVYIGTHQKVWIGNAKDSKIPMSTSCKFGKDEDGTLVDQRVYRSMIGSLLYLTASRSNIMLSVWLHAMFQANPIESDLKAMKKIIKYVKHTTNYGLWYSMHTFWSKCLYRLGLFHIKEW